MASSDEEVCQRQKLPLHLDSTWNLILAMNLPGDVFSTARSIDVPKAFIDTQFKFYISHERPCFCVKAVSLSLVTLC